MSSLFAKQQHPAPLPASPDTAEADRQKQIASDNAIAEAKATGRRSTMVGGQLIAEDEQYGAGLMSRKKRYGSASADMGAA